MNRGLRGEVCKSLFFQESKNPETGGRVFLSLKANAYLSEVSMLYAADIIKKRLIAVGGCVPGGLGGEVVMDMLTPHFYHRPRRGFYQP